MKVFFLAHPAKTTTGPSHIYSIKIIWSEIPFERLGIIEGKRVVYMGKKLNKIKYDKTINGLYSSIRFMSQRRLRGDSQLYPCEFDVREERNFLAATGFLCSQSISRLEFKKGLDRQHLG